MTLKITKRLIINQLKHAHKANYQFMISIMFCIVLMFAISLCNKTKNDFLKKYKLKVMKQTTTNVMGNLSHKQLNQLTTIVTETLATDLQVKNRAFGTADLWYIQRQRKGIPVRRTIF
jgi:hypothetical protein